MSSYLALMAPANTQNQKQASVNWAEGSVRAECFTFDQSAVAWRIAQLVVVRHQAERSGRFLVVAERGPRGTAKRKTTQTVRTSSGERRPHARCEAHCSCLHERVGDFSERICHVRLAAQLRHHRVVANGVQHRVQLVALPFEACRGVAG
jgi:hypothetical protein